MKLQLLDYGRLSIVTVHSDELLAVTAQLCLRPQKNQPHWLASSTSNSTSLSGSLFFFLCAHLHSSTISSTLLLKLQVTSSPA